MSSPSQAYSTHRPVIAIIGCGNMAQAMLGGLVGTNIDAQYHFYCSARSLASANALATRFQAATATTNNLEAVSNADKVILSVKPQQAQQVCAEIKPALKPSCHLSSVMAGVTVDTLIQWCGISAISRIMPNTPALIGQGVSGIYHHPLVKKEDRAFISHMTEQVGLSIELSDEHKIHAITAISGSGPAYFFNFIHHMQQVATELGFSSEEAQKLVNQTALGAAQLVLDSEDDALTLRQKVCSPGGTTEQAINHFEQQNIQQIIADAMDACFQKSIQLSKRT